MLANYLLPVALVGLTIVVLVNLTRGKKKSVVMTPPTAKTIAETTAKMSPDDVLVTGRRRAMFQTRAGGQRSAKIVGRDGHHLWLSRNHGSAFRRRIPVS